MGLHEIGAARYKGGNGAGAGVNFYRFFPYGHRKKRTKVVGGV